jgi:hypothetical protein
MPRPVAMRVNYRSDGAYLLRLQGALLKDDRETSSWREETAKMVLDLARRLLEAESRRTGKVPDVDKRRAPAR